MLSRRSWKDSLAVAISCLALDGCCAYNLVVKSAPELSKTAAVDLVGVSETDKAEWERKKISEYWAPGDKRRQSAIQQEIVHEMKFSAGGQASQTLSKDDAIWGRWRKGGAHWLFVLVDLPGAHADATGAADERRKILPLGCGWLKGTDTVTITLRPDGVSVQPAPPQEVVK